MQNEQFYSQSENEEDYNGNDDININIPQHRTKIAMFKQSSLNNKEQGQLTCGIHPQEILTNFCSCMTCLQTLCPECIDEHNKFHQSQRTYSQITSLKNAKSHCQEKIKQTMNFLSSKLDTLHRDHIATPDNIVKNGVSILQQCQKMVMSSVNSYFNDITDEFIQKAQQAMPIMDSTKIVESLQKEINSLEFLQAELNDQHSNSKVDAIVKVCQLDAKELIDQYERDIKNALEGFTPEYTIDIVVNNNKVMGDVAQMNSSAIKQEVQERVLKMLQGFVNLNKNYIYKSQIMDQILIDDYVDGEKDTSTSLNTKNQKQILSQQDQMLQKERFQQSPIKVITKLQQIVISAKNYFQDKAENKILHFFPNNEKILYLLYIKELMNTQQQKDKLSPSFKQISLKIDFQIPYFHKSIASPNGQIFLIGGSLSETLGQKNTVIYKLQAVNSTTNKIQNAFYQKDDNLTIIHTLIKVGELCIGRSSHCVCISGSSIYTAGGFILNQQFFNGFEKYNITTGQSTQLANMHHAIVSSCIASFNERFIFRFGGIESNFQLSKLIEKYDIEQDQWTLVDATFDVQSRSELKDFHLLSTAAAVQINEDQIFVFGGYLENKKSSVLSFVFCVADESISNNNSNEHIQQKQNSNNYNLIKIQPFLNESYISKINCAPLPIPEGFWNNNPIIYNGSVFATQNISDAANDICLEHNRRILEFNGYNQKWKIHNNDTFKY